MRHFIEAAGFVLTSLIIIAGCQYAPKPATSSCIQPVTNKEFTAENSTAFDGHWHWYEPIGTIFGSKQTAMLKTIGNRIEGSIQSDLTGDASFQILNGKASESLISFEAILVIKVPPREITIITFEYVGKLNQTKNGISGVCTFKSPDGEKRHEWNAYKNEHVEAHP